MDSIYNEVKNSRNFTGKVVLVTGSSTGIGSVIVKLYAALGAHVVITGRNTDGVHKVAQEAQQLSPNKLKPLELKSDLTNSDDLKNLLNETIKTFGKLDVLVNNAAHLQLGSITDETFIEKLSLYEKIDINGNLYLTQLAIPYLEKTKGNVVFITGIQVDRPFKGWLGSIIAKNALESSTKVLSIELGHKGIRVNSVSPGFIESHPEWDDSNRRALFNKAVKATPLGKIGEPIDVAKAVVFLSSTDASFITGQSLLVDGGIQYNLDSNFFEDFLNKFI